MSRQKVTADALSWGACLAVLLGLFLGLDSYRRPTLSYGYGPERRNYLLSSLQRARQLQTSGVYRLLPEERWHLLAGWEEELSTRTTPPKARAVHRRASFVLPVLEPGTLRISIQVYPLPPLGRERAAIDVEYGVDGVAAGRATLPPEGQTLTFTVYPSSLHRGDNVVYLYRLTRRPDPSPWLAVGPIDVENLGAVR